MPSSCPGRVQRARVRERNEIRDPAQKVRSAISAPATKHRIAPRSRLFARIRSLGRDTRPILQPTEDRVHVPGCTRKRGGDRRGQHSIRINDQWRICFIWTVEGPADVEIVDSIKGVPTPNRVTTHPGEVLSEEFLVPLGMSVNALAMALRVPATRIGAIVKGERSVTADTALRLARFFGTSPEFWVNLQAMHDLTKTRRDSGGKIARDVRPRAA